jgi:hypothetical protein
MKFFYADSLDLVDPAFDFLAETSATNRIPQRDDVYAHELYAPQRPYDGILVSKFIVDGGGQGRYTQPQRQRFHREGAQRFLRFPEDGTWDPDNYPILGDCGAFNYHKEHVPPYTVDDILEFYDRCGFTHGISVDHMILDYAEGYDNFGMKAPEEYRRRAELTLDLANQFLKRTRALGLRVNPIGAAQGWSPQSYRKSVEALIKQGYDYIALGGLVPLKTRDILMVLDEVGPVARGKARLHLLGITRIDNFQRFRNAGVVSLDSTSPLRQAFMDSTDNYYADGGHYQALRIPQSDVYPKVVRRIREGSVAQEAAVEAERRCLDVVREFDQGRASVDEVVGALSTYEDLYGGKSAWDRIRRTLSDAPWQKCQCAVCSRLGIDVIIFRGANRNRRRGFHNLWYMHQKLSSYRSVPQECVS